MKNNSKSKVKTVSAKKKTTSKKSSTKKGNLNNPSIVLDRDELISYYNELKARRDELIELKRLGYIDSNDTDYISKKLTFTGGNYKVRARKPSNFSTTTTTTTTNEFLNGFNQTNNDFSFKPKNEKTIRTMTETPLTQPIAPLPIVQPPQNNETKVIKETTIIKEVPAQPIIQQPMIMTLPPQQPVVQQQPVEEPKKDDQTILVVEKNVEEQKQEEIIPTSKYKLPEVINQLLPRQSKWLTSFIVIVATLLSLFTVFIIVWGFASDWTFNFDLFVDNFKNFFKL